MDKLPALVDGLEELGKNAISVMHVTKFIYRL
jgi:hypothetical protein